MEQSADIKQPDKLLMERPWGKWVRYTHNEESTIKLIYVKPNELLSLQYHHERAEFWKVLEGPAKITIADKTIKAEAGEEFYIPVGVHHRLGSFDKPVTILEIAYGHQDENDIVRLEDKYNRKSK